MDLLPQKCKSPPPPKPPRRRHSDQFSVSSSGTFPSARRKTADEIQLSQKEFHSNINSNKSCCGSLPANWTADFHNDEDSTLYKILHVNSSGHLKNITKNNPFVDRSIFDNFKSSKSAVDAICKNHIECKSSDYQYLQHVMENEVSFSKFYSNSQFGDQFLIDMKKNGNICNNKDILKNIKTNMSNLKFQKDYHRRHHSDPSLSCFDRSNTRSNLCKSTIRSHSFMGCTTSEKNKLNDSINICFTCKENSCLYEEMQILKEINNKLWQHLCSVQSCLESLQKKSLGETNNLRISDLLSNVYYALKARDCAMEERLKVAFEDRNSALQELDELIHMIVGSFEGTDVYSDKEKSSNEEIQELLHEIQVTHNPSKLLQHQRMILSHLFSFKQSSQKQLSHQLKLIVAERDGLLEKVQKLEEELKDVKFCNDIWHLDNKYWENNLLDILCHIIQQRDLVLSKLEQSQSMDYIYLKSPQLQKAHTVDQHMNSGCESVQKWEDLQKSYELSHISDHLCSQFSLDTSDNDMNLLNGKIAILTKALEVEIEKREIAEGKCKRLERLVNVLQKKLSGQSVGIHV